MLGKLMAVSTAALIAAAGTAGAQDYPEAGRTITTIVPSTAGGGTDTAARLIAPFLEEELGTTVEIVNRPGASMQIGLTEVAQAEPHGYTLVWSVLPTAASIYLDPDRGAAFQRDSLEPIAMYYGAPFGIAVLADSPHETLQDLVDAAKESPGTIRSGTTGFMSTGHFANIAFQEGTDTEMATVNFQGGGPQLTALLGGHIDVGFNSIGELLSQQKSGEIRVLAVMDPERSELLPDVPTVAEAGFEVEPIGSDIGLSAPAGTPQPILDRLNEAMEAAMANEEVKSRMLELGNTVNYLGPQEYAEFWDAVDARFEPLITIAKQQGE